MSDRILTGAQIAAAHRRKCEAGPDLYRALERVWDAYGFDPSIDSGIWQEVREALAKADGVK